MNEKLEASGEEAFTAGVRLLLSLAITRRPVAWQGTSKALSAAAELRGLRESLGRRLAGDGRPEEKPPRSPVA